MSLVIQDISSDYLQHVVDVDNLLIAQKLTRLSAMIVVLYDILLTMDKEIEYFWKQRWSLIKSIYFINRYGGLLFLVIDTWGKFQFYFQQWTGWIAVLLVETILIIRVNTLYERSRNSTILLSFLFFLQAGIMAAVLIAWDTVQLVYWFEDTNSCGSYNRPPFWLAAFWVPPIVVDFSLFILTLRKSLALYRMSPSKGWDDLRLHKTLVRDQAIYFIGILTCSLANMTFLAFYPNIMCAALGFALGFPCVMGSRILLNLREIAREEMRCGISTGKVFTSLNFAEASALQRAIPEEEDDSELGLDGLELIEV